MLLQEASGAAWDFFPLVVSYLSTAVPQIFIIVYLLRVQHEPLADYGIIKPKASTWGWAAVAFVLALFIMFAVILVYSLLPETIREGLLREQQFSVASYAELPLALLFCLAVGYREELFFRAYLGTRLGQLGVKPVWTVLGTSLIFGMAHFGQGLFAIFTTFAIGLVFGLFFNAKKDLHLVALAHTFYNFTLITISLAGRNLQP